MSQPVEIARLVSELEEAGVMGLVVNGPDSDLDRITGADTWTVHAVTDRFLVRGFHSTKDGEEPIHWVESYALSTVVMVEEKGSHATVTVLQQDGESVLGIPQPTARALVVGTDPAPAGTLW